LIEQVQFTGEENISGNNGSKAINYKSKLQFNHPTKELIWAIKNSVYAGDDRASGSNGVGHRFLAYTNRTPLWYTVGLQDAANNLANNMVRLTASSVNGGADPLSNLKLATIVVGIPNTVQVFDLQTNTDIHKIRFNVFVANNSACNGKNLELNRYPLYSGNLSGSSGAPSGFNFSDYLDEINVNIDQENGNISATVVSQHLSLNDISIPLDTNSAPNYLVDTRFLSTSSGNPYDIYVIQFNNYGLRLDGRGNPVAEANIQLNGHDRFDTRRGSYFNYVQPWQHHTHTPADGINVYSFALHPEQHQPSGTANLSRIDNTVLILKLQDPLRSNNCDGSYSTQLVVDLSNSRLYTFAFNYNVLRIMSGMGGLAYSN